MTTATRAAAQFNEPPQSRNRLFRFLAELRRRRVCRAITMYSVAIWLVCQIVDVVSPALALPEWTLKLVVVFGLLGLPLIVIASWLFEITPDGLVVDGPAKTPRNRPELPEPKHTADRFIDCSLIFAALVIGAQLAIGTLDGGATVTEDPPYRVAVMPFRATSGETAAGLSEGLAVELQHALRQQLGITVIASSNPALLRGSASITGAVTAGKAAVRVAVTMIDFDSGVVLWSAAFQRPRTDSYALSSEFAHQIVAALPLQDENGEPVRLANVVR